MLTNIIGVCNNGKIVLDEMPPNKNKLKVVAAFLEEIQSPDSDNATATALAGQISLFTP